MLGFFVLDKESQFPGWWASIPIIGTALIIFSSSSAWFNRVILSNRLMVFIGLISFPLYLWHWPALSFPRILYGEEVPQIIRIYAILFSFVMAWLTYYFVEKEIRFGALSIVKTHVLFILMLALGALGYICYTYDGFMLRATLPQVVNVGDIGEHEFFNYLNTSYNPCQPIDIQKDAGSWNGIVQCFQSKKNKSIQLAIIGDSHAEHLFPGLADALVDTNVVEYGKGALPLLSSKEFKKIFDYVINDVNIKTIIIAARWDAKIKTISRDIFQSDLFETIKVLTDANKKVLIIDDVPSFTMHPSKCKYVGRFGLKNNCKENIDNYHQQLSYVEPILALLVKKNKNVKIIKLGKYFCRKDFCLMAKNGVLFFRDTNHLNIKGSRYIGQLLAQEYSELSGKFKKQL